MIGDEDRKVAELYGMIDSQSKDNATIRTVFIIDPKKTIRLTAVVSRIDRTQL